MNHFLLSYPQMTRRVDLLVELLGFVGIKHLMSVMFLIMLYQMSLWQYPWIYVMMNEGKKRFRNFLLPYISDFFSKQSSSKR